MDRHNRFSETNHADRTPIFVTLTVVAVLAVGVTLFSGGDDDKVEVTELETPAAVAQTGTTTDGSTATSTGEIAVPPRPAATFASGLEAYKQRKYDDAVEAFESYALRHPENAYGHYMVGLSAWKAGDLELARLALERSLELDSTNVKTLLNLGRVLLDKGLAADAKPKIQRAVTLDSESAEVHRMLARVQSALGQRDSAEASYRVALSIDPADSWSMNNLGLLLIEGGRYEEALMPLARAVALKPEAPAFANNLGLALERTGHPGSAAVVYRSALAVDSTYTKAARSLARVDGRVDDTPIDVATLAAQFGDILQSSARPRMLAKGPGKPDA